MAILWVEKFMVEKFMAEKFMVEKSWLKNSWLKSLGLKSPGLKLGVEMSYNNAKYMIKISIINYREMVKLVNQCHLVKLQMEVAIQWQFVFLMELEEWFNVSAAPDLQVGKTNICYTFNVSGSDLCFLTTYLNRHCSLIKIC